MGKTNHTESPDKVATVFRPNPRQREMVHKFIELSNKERAYEAVYGRGNYSKAAFSVRVRQAFAHPTVVEYMEKMNEKHAERHAITVDTLLAELEEARELARQEKQPSAMVSASMGKAKIAGHDKKTIDHKSSDGTMTPAPTVIRLVGPEDYEEVTEEDDEGQ